MEEGSEEPDGGAGVGVSRRVRRGVHLFLLAFAVTGVLHLELWPFTGFRLFSEVRTAQHEGWAIVAVDGDGEERAIRLAQLPVAFRNTGRLIDGFDRRSTAERDAICDAWADAARAHGEDVDRVRIYSVVESVRPDGPPPVRTLAYECGTGR